MSRPAEGPHKAPNPRPLATVTVLKTKAQKEAQERTRAAFERILEEAGKLNW